MQKLKKSFLLYFGLMFLSVVFYQCCTGSFNIDGIRELKITDNVTLSTDTISNQFEVDTWLEGEVVSQENKLNLFQSAWATSCDYHFENPIVEETVSISFSQDFTYDGNTITSGTNIHSLNLENLVFNINGGGHLSGMKFEFTSLFINNANFPEGDYEITVAAETSDGIILEEKVSTYFKFD